MSTEDSARLAAAVTAERFAAGEPVELAPLMRGWVCRYAVLVDDWPQQVHHIDPSAPASASRKGWTCCEQPLAMHDLWWRVPDEVVQQVLAGDESLWTVCAVCADKVYAAAVAAAAD